MADMRAGPRPDEVAARTFPTSFRGFDPTEVRGYLAEVASALAAAATREEMLREDLARVRATLASPAIDESVLLELLGDEAARVLQVAKEAAADIRGKADANAAVALDQAHGEADRIRSEAHAAADRLRRDAEGVLAIRTAEADAAAARLLEAAEVEAAAVREGGLAEARAMVAEARAVRERMLGDLKRRVQRGEATVEVLRVGRERLLEAFGVVRDRLDDATHSLATAEARARKEAGEEAERLGNEAAAVVDRVSLMEPTMPELQPAAAADERGEARRREALPAEAEPGTTTVEPPEAVEPAEPVEPVEPPKADEAPAAQAAAEPEVHTGEPSGEVAEVVPIGGSVIAEEEDDEHAPSPLFDSPAAAPSTGEVPAIAATGTDSQGIGRRRRRMLRLADEPAVRAEEQRLAQLRYLHRPRTGGEPEVHLPEDGMVVVEPPSAGEAVRVLPKGPGGPEARGPGPARPPEPPEPGDQGVTVLDRAPSAAAPATPAAPAARGTAPEAPVPPAAPAARGTAPPPEAPAPPAAPTEPAAEPPGAPAGRPDAAALFARLRADRQAAAEPTAPQSTASAPEPVADELLLQARDRAVEPVEHLLAKKVKRLLQDHQNAVLDRLRARRPPTALELLGEVEDLLGPLATAAAPLLGDAATAGAAAAGAPATSVPTADLARDVAANVVKDLRPRLERAYSVENPEPRVDRVNVAFREWRGERVGRLVGDAAHAAFARGQFVATAARTPLRWVADDGERPCPDCEDNSLAGSTPKGTPFPTGHRHPPAHSGCRCLLAAPTVSPPGPKPSSP